MREIKFRAWDGERMETDFAIHADGRVGMFHPATSSADDVYETYIPMQFTGLKDKNGKEIYEGDIVVTSLHKTEPDFFEPVEWADMYGGFHPFSASLLPVGHLYEIIGNIYENKDLLK